MRVQVRLPIALVGVVLLAVSIANPAMATHPRPKGATPVRLSLVPAYNACTAPNRTHGPPLAFPSCNPPVESSSSLTVGTPDANGAVANMEGFIHLEAKVGVAGPPDDSDVLVDVEITDVFCKAGVSACTGGPLTDYTGELLISAALQGTDHFNAVAPGGGTDAATVAVGAYWMGPFAASCAPTPDALAGSTCTAHTSSNATVPGAIKDAKRLVVEFGQWTVTDGGPDGINGTYPNTLFGATGVFVP